MVVGKGRSHPLKIIVGTAIYALMLSKQALASTGP